MGHAPLLRWRMTCCSAETLHYERAKQRDGSLYCDNIQCKQVAPLYGRQLITAVQCCVGRCKIDSDATEPIPHPAPQHHQHHSPKAVLPDR